MRILFVVLLFLLSAGPLLAADPEIEMVFVKGGCYRMGDAFGEGSWEERPVHEVCVDDFFIGKYLVTQAQYEKVMGKNPSQFKGCGPDCPVENVSLDDAEQFIIRLNRLTGRNYRLPYEAEWEYAARSAGKNEKWAGTGNRAELPEYAWFADNSDKRSHPVGTRKPNGLGLCDMSGNVWQWCKDWYKDNYYEKSPKKNPRGLASGFLRVLRGGSWNNPAAGIRATIRDGFVPDYRDGSTGFRLVLPADQGKI